MRTIKQAAHDAVIGDDEALFLAALANIERGEDVSIVMGYRESIEDGIRRMTPEERALYDIEEPASP